jgi:hypothetical protein
LGGDIMKRLVLGLALGSCTACFSTPALGQTRPGFEVGLEVFQIGYKEFDEGDLFIRQDGRLVGLNFSYVQPITGSLFGRATISGAAGSVDYDPLDEPVVEDVKQSQGRFEIHLGYDFELKGVPASPRSRATGTGSTKTKPRGSARSRVSRGSTVRSNMITCPSASRAASRWGDASG